MRRVRNKPAEQLWLPLYKGDCVTLAECTEHPVEEGLLERILNRENLVSALNRFNLTSRTALVREPYARWCGRNGVARLRPIPIQ